MLQDAYLEDIPDDAREYYKQVEQEVIKEEEYNNPVLAEITLKNFVSTSKGRNRKRKALKEVTLVKYGHNYHQPHRFDWWIAGLELLGDLPDVEIKIQDLVLGNQAYNLNSMRGG
jgi:hypothetical protein